MPFSTTRETIGLAMQVFAASRRRASLLASAELFPARLLVRSRLRLVVSMGARRSSPRYIMAPSMRLAFLGNSLPRRCGIATFTNDLQQAVATSRHDIETAIVAMTDHGQSYEYPP